MTVTLEIPIEVESAIRARAEQYDLPLSDYFISLYKADVEEDYSLSPQEIIIIQQGLEELRAGNKGILLEDLRFEVNAEHLRKKQQGSVVRA